MLDLVYASGVKRGGTTYIIGVTPDLEVKVRLDVLEEIDFLAERYALFRRAS